MEAKGPFTMQLWSDIETLYKQIVAHPFVVQLADGTLNRVAFAHYLAQDILYIHDDSVALEQLSTRSENTEEAHFFSTLAKDGIEIEKLLHAEFLDHFNVKKANQKSPVIEAYTHFLLQHSTRSSFAIAASALLPCFWVYNRVGSKIYTASAPANPYQKWIDTYQGAEYESYTSEFIQRVEEMGKQANPQVQEAMRKAFVQATQHELAFFQESLETEGRI